MSENEKLRELPAVHEVMERISAPGIPRQVVVAEIRRALDEARSEIRSGVSNGLSIEARVERACAALARCYASAPASEPPGLWRPAAREPETTGSAQTRFIVAANRASSS